MPEISEYDYYDGTLAITVATQRPGAAPSSVLAAASLHEEFASRVRCALREYKHALDPYLAYYRVEKIQPAGTARDTDNQANMDFLRLQFSLGLALLESAWSADERLVFAIERNIERAVHELFEAQGLPHTIIPGDATTLGESYIGVQFSTGAATNIGTWQVPG